MASAPPHIFDRTAISRARDRARRISDDPFLFREAADGVRARIAPINRQFLNAVDIEPHGAAIVSIRDMAKNWSTATFTPDERLQASGTGFDLATSVLELHTINDLPGALMQVRRLLAPDGVFCAALFGSATLCELRDSFAGAEAELNGGASPRVLPFADVRDLGNLLHRAGFALPVADVERTIVRYREFGQLIHDLRAHAQTNSLVSRARLPVSRRLLSETIARYHQRYAEPDGRLRATFEIIYVVGWAPADNQPKALKPGSAKVSLASWLGSRGGSGKSVASS